MKHWTLTLLLVFVSFGAWAQYAQPGAEYKRAGGTIKVDGEKLSKEACMELLTQAGGEQLYKDWKNANDMRTTGIVMTSVGGGVGAIGLGVAFMGGLVSILGAAAGATTGAIVGSIGGEDAASSAAQQGASQGGKAGNGLLYGGLAAAGLGFGTMIAGIPILAVNCSKMNKIVKGLNEAPQPAPQFGLGATENGLGLVLLF